MYCTICLLPGNFADCKPCAQTGFLRRAGGAARRSAADVRHGIVTAANQNNPTRFILDNVPTFACGAQFMSRSSGFSKQHSGSRTLN